MAIRISTNRGDTLRDLVILIIVAMLAALLPSNRSVRIKVLDAIWGT
jgi:ABC-type lipoprotein release transport system permease subunit